MMMKGENDGSGRRGGLTSVRVPEWFQDVFLQAQAYVDRYFQDRKEIPEQGMIEISGERYILVRAASMSKEFFDLVSSLYHDRGEGEARSVAFGFLFDIAHAIGKADAKSFFAKMGLKEPIERLSAGPVHFAYTGWAYVDIFPESNPTPDEDYYLIYDHPFSFEAHTWMKTGKKTDFPVCAMNAGYSSGWCEESFDIGLVAAEVECRARGDAHCRFIMAPPARIKEYIERYGKDSGAGGFGSTQVPEFFQRKRLEDDLLKSEETVRALLNAPSDSAWLLDTEGKVLALNSTAAGALGQCVEELVGKNAFDFFPPTVARRRKGYHDQVVQSGRSFRYEDQRDGRWMDTTVDPVRDSKGKVARVAVFSRDMTEHKQMEEAVRKEKEFTANLIRTSPAFFFAVAADGKVLHMNEVMVEALGYSAPGAGGRDRLQSILSETDWSGLQDVFRRPPSEGERTVTEVMLLTGTGRELIVEWHSRHVVDAQGRPDYFLALGVDVTERKRAEEELRRHRDNLEELVGDRTNALRETVEKLKLEIAEREQAERALKKSETMLRAIFDQTFQFIGILRLDGVVVKVNKTAMDFVGTTEEEIAGRSFWDTPWWRESRKEQERLRQAVTDAARGNLVRFEATHRGPGGRKINVDFSLKPVKDETGQIVLLIAEGRDIAELKAAVEDLRKREKQMQTQSRKLEETNIALKVLLKKMEEKKEEERENVLSNVKQLVVPYLKRLKKGRLSGADQILVATLESNLHGITGTLVSRLSSSFLGLTPMEIRIAHLVKEGLTNKEIAELLGICLNTVSSHRYKIRTKLSLRNQGKNLRSHLLSLGE